MRRGTHLVLNGITGFENQVEVKSATKKGCSGRESGATDTFVYGIEPLPFTGFGVKVK